jgi:ABC-type multidrug transport system fused ATPase/permease subunit
VTNKNFTQEIRVAFSILSKQDKIKLAIVILAQMILGLFDLIGIALFGVLGALAVSGVESSAVGDRVSKVLSIVNIQDTSIQKQVMIIGMLACGFLIMKTLLSMSLMKRIYLFMNGKSADISTQLTSQLLGKNILEIQARSTQENIFHLTYGVNAVAVGVVGTSVTLVADAFLSLILFTGLLIFNWALTVSTIIFFGLVATVLYVIMAIKARNLGSRSSTLGIQSNLLLEQSMTMYKELLVSNRLNDFIIRISRSRHELAKVTAELNFMGNISKYVIEISVVVGFLSLSAIQFMTQDAKHAIATLSVFFAASTRIAPSVLRMQQGLVGIKSQLAAGSSTIELIRNFRPDLPEKQSHINFDNKTKYSEEISYPGFVPNVSIQNLTFSYPQAKSPALDNVSLEVWPGQIIAITGPSGGGKSTLIDALLGVLPIPGDCVSISGKPARECFTNWPGAISYVSQSHPVINGSVRENICLGVNPDAYSEDKLWAALEIAHLNEYIRSLPAGLDTQIGDRGSRFSGGQKQRLGIARAILTNPKLLILDEATSALDNETESAISSAINSMRGSVTVIMVAHRLTSISQADTIYFIESGKISISGTFQELKRKIPGFGNGS